MSGNRESASALNVQRDRNGQSWISVDSLVDLFSDMASGLADGPAKQNLETLATLFRPASTYEGLMQVASSDDSMMQAAKCSCGTAVIEARSIGGDAVLVDAAPVADGELFPVRIRDGVPTVAPYRPALDGATNTRLREHYCIARPRRAAS